MKKTAVLLVLLLGVASLRGQNIEESVMFSKNYYMSTARSAAMGGAFGALGADFSSLSSNPAGIGVYRKSEFNFTPELYVQNSDATYLPGMGNNSYDDNRFNFNFNNLGLVMAFTTGKDKGLVNLNFGIGFNRLNAFHADYIIKGENNNSSMIDNAVDGSVGLTPDTLNPYYEQLFFYAYMIDTFSDSTSYASNATLPTDQRREVNRKGRVNEWLFSSGMNISNKLYLGFSLAYQSLYYKYELAHREDFVSDVDGQPAWFDYRKELKVYGNGVNFKAGVIYRPLQFLRIGAAVHTPTFYSIDEEFDPSIDATYLGGRIYPADQYGDLGIDLNEYWLQTPMKLIGSLAFVIGKYGIISFDYDYMDYSQIRYSGVYDKSFADQLEKEVENDLTKVHNIRGGAEVRLGPVYLRGGYAYFGTPYSSGTWYENAFYQQFSGGIGINTGPARIDLAYMRGLETTYYNMYSVEGRGHNLSEMDITRNYFKVTTTFRF